MKTKQFPIAIIFLLFVNTISFSQPFQIGHTTISFIDGTRNNRVIATEIYYPSDVAGDNVALTTSTTVLFPVLSFGHGFAMTWDAYQNFWSALVPNGYIMAFPKTEGSLSPSHLEFGKDLAFVISQMTALGNNSTSIFYNRISIMNSVMGHSMGGGASFLAAQLNSTIKTIVNFAPAETNPSAIQAATSISKPSLIFAGVNDCVTPPNTNQIPMYNALASSCKTLISIIGGSHCQMANNNFFCGVGESSCSPQPGISRTAQQNIIYSYLLPWLDYQLKGNCNQGNVFDTLITTDNAIIFQKNCTQCTNLDVAISTDTNQIKIYPNPVKDFITITGKMGVKYVIEIYDITSKRIINQQFVSEISIETSNFNNGIYTFSIKSNNEQISKGKFIK
jgi:pimeloyl-ACP methyl ester carboxylesterase